MAIGFTCVGGYLGSGKTTLLNDLLATASGQRYAVVVNDFGDINIDASLIASHDGDTIELSNGCICCSLAGDFGEVMADIASREPPVDHVIVEVSGVGDPWQLTPWGQTPGFDLCGVVVVIDLERAGQLTSDKFVGDTVRKQLEQADLIVATKADLLDADAVPDRLALVASHSGSPVFVAPFDLALVVADYTAASRSSSVTVSPHALHKTISVRADQTTIAEIDDVVAVLRRAPAGVVRAKGITAGHIVQMVGRRIETTPVATDTTNTGLVIIASPTVDQSDFEKWATMLRGSGSTG